MSNFYCESVKCIFVRFVSTWVSFYNNFYTTIIPCVTIGCLWKPCKFRLRFEMKMIVDNIHNNITTIIDNVHNKS